MNRTALFLLAAVLTTCTAVAAAAVRSGGTGCRVQAWKPSFGLENKGDLSLTRTEFPDPDGKATYFRLRDFSVAVDDELFAGKARGGKNQ